jgi:hypothetical protein
VKKRDLVMSLAVVLALFSAAACGSTNRNRPEQLAEGTATDGGSTSSASAPGTSGATPSGAPRSASASGGTGASTAPGAGAEDGTSGATSSGAIRPTDKTPLKLGFIIIKGGDALVANGLGTPVSFGNGKKQVAALVKDLNGRGGIHGRPIVPVYYEWNVANTNDSPARGCVELTEDHHVFAILTVVNVDQEMVGCAAKHRTLLINASFGAGDSYLYEHFGDWFFSPSLLLLNRQKSLLLQSLKAAGRLGRNVKVGVAILGGEDGQQYQRVANTSIIPTLDAWKVPYTTYEMASDADVSGAVLRFRSEGVNLVIFSSASAIPPMLFMRQANSQGWAPGYALTDADDSNTLGTYVPRSQAQKIVGVGTQPISNVAVRSHPHTKVEERCLAIMRTGGENDTDRRSNLTAEPYCEAVWDFEAVAKRVTGTLTADAFRRAFASVGTSYDPVMTFSTNFANGRHTNAAQYKDFAWKSSCGCVAYTSGSKPIPK